MASGIFAIGADFRRMCGEVPQILPEIQTKAEARKSEPLGKSLLAIDSERGEGEKVITWANELTLEQAKSD
ncbi:hypothetical protein [Anabaena sp. CCY 9910]|uniref:hypothetical protein n=1 Tax=Anabaena sp. CCY 9910 TaxID=3103870 RepID=UPI0039E12F2B